jgi:hypothetical protein
MPWFIHSCQGKLFAVKRIEMLQGRRDELDDLVQEIDLMRGLSHPNIVEYIGASVSQQTPFFRGYN